jgi:hypothetical protein
MNLVTVSLHPLRKFKIQRLIILVYMDFLNPAIASAFGMSTIAAEQLDQTNNRVTDLARYIFGYYIIWEGALCNYFRPYKTRRCGLANQYQAPFTKLSQAGNDGSSDILVYCDQTRFEQNSEGQWIDTISKQVGNINQLYACNSDDGSLDVGSESHVLHVFAWTTATAIQLCPWYMKYSLKNFQDGGFAYVTADLVQGLSSRTPSTTDWPQIQYFALLDFFILHEVCITAVSCTD